MKRLWRNTSVLGKAVLLNHAVYQIIIIPPTRLLVRSLSVRGGGKRWEVGEGVTPQCTWQTQAACSLAQSDPITFTSYRRTIHIQTEYCMSRQTLRLGCSHSASHASMVTAVRSPDLRCQSVHTCQSWLSINCLHYNCDNICRLSSINEWQLENQHQNSLLGHTMNAS